MTEEFIFFITSYIVNIYNSEGPYIKHLPRYYLYFSKKKLFLAQKEYQKALDELTNGVNTIYNYFLHNRLIGI